MKSVGLRCGFLCACVAGALSAAGSTAFAAEEIVVTGERREQAAAELPSSVSVIGAAELQRIGADHPSEILNRAAGVLINRGNGQEHLTAIRSPVLTGGAGAGSFLYLENNVPLRSAGFANVNGLFDAQTELASRIEIIKGPGGALYGANAIHGVVNVLTPAPSEDFSGHIEISADTVERVKGTTALSDTIGANGFYAGLALSSEAGYRADSGADQQKLLLRHDYNGDKVSVATIFSATNLNQETAGYVEGPDAYLDPVLRRTNPNPEAFRDTRSILLSSRIDIDAGENLTLSVTPFARWTDMDFLLHFLPSQALEENGHWSAGAQSALYADPSPRLSVIAGLDWEYTEGFLREEQSIPTVFSYTQGVHYDYDVTALSASPFVQARYKLAPRLTAVIAGRLDWTRYEYDNKTGDGVVGRFLRPADRTDNFVTASPKASLIYEAGAGTGYVSYARGARPPQTTDLYRLQINQTDNGALPEFIDAFEIGWRGALGPRIDYDLAAYFMKKRNFFFRDADGFNVDDGRTRHLGVEAEATARVTDALSIDANVSYGAHTYRFDRPVLSLPQASEAISFGDDVDTAPRWLAGARGKWAPASLPVSAEIEWLFVDQYFEDAANTAVYPGHHLVNLRASWRLVDGLTVNFAVRNLLDKFYAERADYAFGSERYFPGEPRTYSFGLRAEF